MSSCAAACVCTSSRAIASMPDRNSPGSAAPFAICVRLFSHSAVSCGEVSISGSTDIRAAPFCVGISCFPLRSAKPPFTSFSMTAARVAGVPSPRRSASGSVSPFPARSIAERSDASGTLCQGCLRNFLTIIQNKTLDFVAHVFFACVA